MATKSSYQDAIAKQAAMDGTDADDDDGFDIIAVVEEKVGRVTYGGHGSAIVEAFRQVGKYTDDNLLVSNKPTTFRFVVEGYKMVLSTAVEIVD